MQDQDFPQPPPRALFRDLPRLLPADPSPPPEAAEPPRPRRILYVDHTAELGGGEIALLHLVQRLDRSRFEPLVVLSAEGPLRGRLREAGVETHLLALAPSVREARKDALGPGTLLRLGDAGRTVRYVARLARLIRAQRIALVHTNSLKADVLGGLAARLARVPLVWHVRDRIDADYLPRPAVWAFRRLCRWVPQYVIANSESTLETLALPASARSAAVFSGIDVASRARVVHDGVSQSEGGAGQSQGGAGQSQGGAGQSQGGAGQSQGGAGQSQGGAGQSEGGAGQSEGVSAPPGNGAAPARAARIGLIGRISPWKGQHVFLRAAAAVREKFPDARFQVIGSALFGEQAYEREIRGLALELGLADSVEFLGFREDVPDLVAALDVVVHASTTAEPFGQVIVEAMAAGKPVVATDGGGPREIVVPGETGLLVPMGDPEAMAAAVVSLLGDPAAAREMGRRGRRRASDVFSIERTARKVEAVYDALLGTGACPPAGA